VTVAPDDLRTASDFVREFMAIVTLSAHGDAVQVTPPEGMSVEECGRKAAGLVSRLRKGADEIEGQS